MNNPDPTSLNELRSRYPYQFSGPWLEIEVAKGWFALFAQLCADVDQALGADTYGFYWSQIKEKFGSARFYYRFGEREPVPSDYRPDRDHSRNYQQVIMAVSDLTEQAEEATLSTCLACGKTGRRDSTGGYLLVLCLEHRAKRWRSADGSPLIEWETLDGVDSQSGDHSG
jgi:hypothetical protein